jgi:hypothetical protein
MQQANITDAACQYLDVTHIPAVALAYVDACSGSLWLAATRSGLRMKSFSARGNSSSVSLSLWARYTFNGTRTYGTLTP